MQGNRASRPKGALTAAVPLIFAMSVPGAAAMLALPVCAASADEVQLAIADFEVAPDGSAASVRLVSPCRIQADGGRGMVAVPDGLLSIPLDFDPHAGVQTVHWDVTDGASSGLLSIEYYPREQYQSLGSSIPGTILLASALPRAAEVEIDPAVTAAPTAADLISLRPGGWNDARERGLVPPAGMQLESAVLGLLDIIATENDPVGRQLCPEDQPGIDQLKAVLGGSCYVWCTGLAAITRGFLRSSGIPARVVQLVSQESRLDDGTLVQSSEAHTTIEWWDGTRWAWLGPTLGVLRVTDRGGQPLSIDGLVKALVDSPSRDGLAFTRLNASQGSWETRTWGDEGPDFQAALARYFTSDKTVKVVFPPSPPLDPAIGPLLLVAIGSLLVSIVSRLQRRRTG
jgi:hypothetical protein